ncbi:MAG: molybdopterin-dependent oxidoreductase [Firmicutes bacterium]|jgi:DMSO/TMAO reductase YedYZ molybdopterin-dependent catalytic subunit|nr:molybdopterin-dependent oxidoreductase [Bacillota bacterium]
MTFRDKHWRHVILIALFVFTGLGLFLATWRRALGPWFPVVQDVHEFGGIIYGIALVGWGARFFPISPGKYRPGYARWGYFWLVCLVVTGAGLLVGPSWTRSIATVGHAMAATGFIIWALWHLLTRLPYRKIRRIAPQEGWGIRVNRRRFLRWGIASLAAIPAASALPTLLKMVGGRLTPSFHATSIAGALPGFTPYTVTGSYPHLERASYRLTLEGLGPTQTFNWTQLTQGRALKKTINFRCVTGWVVPDVKVEGLDLVDFLARHGWTGDRRQEWVTFYSGDGVYTETMNVQELRQYRPMLAWGFDGKPLPISQGYPVRLLVPNMYGYKSIKWLVRIRVGPTSVPGYWEQLGYPQDAYYGSYDGI